jgi:hypothetical protein
VIVSFSEILGEIEDPDPGPTLRIYGDGRAVVHRPRYMKNSGDHVRQLEPGELEALLVSLAGKLATFDAATARDRKRAADAARPSRSALQPGEPIAAFDASDPSTIVITLRLERYEPPAGRGPALVDVERSISWRGLRADARRYPDVAEIQDLAGAQRELIFLMRDVPADPR